MPELPEVENVKLDFLKSLPMTVKIKKVTLSGKKLRFAWPKNFIKNLAGQKIISADRRAKYLVLELENSILISHLGMTGSWRFANDKKDHDHLIIYFNSDQLSPLIYCDPRRFGYVDLVDKKEFKNYHRFKHLGVEPFDKKFNGKYLFELSRKKSISVKSFIMDQRVVVGVGNIYASECLFLSRVKPTTSAKNLSLKQYELIAREIVNVLNEAIRRGGSTIRDFQYGKSKKGGFQNYFKVYGRESKPCLECSNSIQKNVIAGRSTFFCKHCQK